MKYLLSTRLVFLVAGISVGGWAPLVPFAQARAGIDEGGLGLLLLCLGIGSILSMAPAGVLAARLGCRRVLIASTLLIIASLPLLALLSNPWLLGAALFVFGAGLGALDCVVNIQAVIVEREDGRTLMSGFHGMFSLGGILGAGGVAALLRLGVEPFGAALAVSAVLAALTLMAAPHLLTRGGEGGSAFGWPRGPVLVIGLFCFVLFLAEGSMLDWSAVAMTKLQGLDPAIAGLGYAAFSATMTSGRLFGDAIVRRIGPGRVLVLGPVLAASGIALATMAPDWRLALVGYALVGAGCSNVVPVLFSAVGRQTAMPESAAVPAIATLGYAGILTGPALVGFAAHLTGLAMAMLGLAGLLLLVAVNARAVR